MSTRHLTCYDITTRLPVSRRKHNVFGQVKIQYETLQLKLFVR